MTDDDLLRYSRHLLLDEIGIEGQRRLLDAKALIETERTALTDRVMTEQVAGQPAKV